LRKASFLSEKRHCVVPLIERVVYFIILGKVLRQKKSFTAKKTVLRCSTVCLWFVGLSSVYLRFAKGLSTVCPQFVDALSTVCLRFVYGLSTVLGLGLRQGMAIESYRVKTNGRCFEKTPFPGRLFFNFFKFNIFPGCVAKDSR
jgi:hypothetical protein